MTTDPHESSAAPDSKGDQDHAKPRIKIGTQRPGAAAPRLPPRYNLAFSTPEPNESETITQQTAPVAEPAAPQHSPVATGPVTAVFPAAPTPAAPTALDSAASDSAMSGTVAPPMADLLPKPVPLAPSKSGPAKPPIQQKSGPKVPPPNMRAELTPDLAQELEEALGNMSVDELIAAEKNSSSPADELEAESRHTVRIIRTHRDNVFVELGGHKQGVLPLKQFAEPPEPGTYCEVIVNRFDADEGLYELTLPEGAVSVSDWSHLAEGMVVETLVTGHNKGGLECEVSRIRGFIPASQISIYRTENLEPFVGQKFPCVVTEANPERRNLVLSRRAMLEREQVEAKKKLIAELEVGQMREGVVRSLRDFGAFVDLGGVDGMVHVSQISWDRIKHPSDVLQIGQKLKVKIEKINPETGKISLTCRDLAENPWANVTAKYPVTGRVKGRVSKLTEFGAFVRLEAGVEGLIHISELAHKRVLRASDVVSEGQEVEVKVLSVDPEAQRISLSLKALEARPEPARRPEPEEPDPQPSAPASKRKTPLKGGLGRSPGSEQSGLRW